MGKRASTKRWVQQQANDPYVKARIDQGLRSRAAFKLNELLAKDKLLPSGGIAIDLGAAPGGWSEIIAKIVGNHGLVVSVDLLEMRPIAGVHFIKGDCLRPEIISQLTEIVGVNNADLVLSDMAPNITGIRDQDEANFLDIADAVIEVAAKVLKPNGGLILKMFQFPGTDAFVKELKTQFSKVARRKPPASRKQSKEFYVVASGYRL